MLPVADVIVRFISLMTLWLCSARSLSPSCLKWSWDRGDCSRNTSLDFSPLSILRPYLLTCSLTCRSYIFLGFWVCWPTWEPWLLLLWSHVTFYSFYFPQTAPLKGGLGLGVFLWSLLASWTFFNVLMSSEVLLPPPETPFMQCFPDSFCVLSFLKQCLMMLLKEPGFKHVITGCYWWILYFIDFSKVSIMNSDVNLNSVSIPWTHVLQNHINFWLTGMRMNQSNWNLKSVKTRLTIHNWVSRNVWILSPSPHHNEACPTSSLTQWYSR